ncbi:hypothetical protein MPSEU_000813100 [Mayamaea pseudoterrestris]|nr:hypothetical protein MPSEU_000813100 [Mayamaea pseudoterrestris]
MPLQHPLTTTTATRRKSHVRSDSWRNAFYHDDAAALSSQQPILTTPHRNNSILRHQRDHNDSLHSMADIADIAVNLEGGSVNLCELGAAVRLPSSTSKMPSEIARRRKRKSTAKKTRSRPHNTPPRGPVSPHRRRAAENVFDEQPNTPGGSVGTDYFSHERIIAPLTLTAAATTASNNDDYEDYSNAMSSSSLNYGSLNERQPMMNAASTAFSNVTNPPALLSHTQAQDITTFSAMANQHRSTLAPAAAATRTVQTVVNKMERHASKNQKTNGSDPLSAVRPSRQKTSKRSPQQDLYESSYSSATINKTNSNEEDARSIFDAHRWQNRFADWLVRDAHLDQSDGTLYFDYWSNWSMAGWVRHYLHNPLQPEFSSLQQFNWAVIIGIVMGLYTAGWKYLINQSVHFVWVKVPLFLLRNQVFSGMAGTFPLYHYMWIAPACFASVLSYLVHVYKMPDQNSWITDVHRRGVQDHTSFVALFLISTASMASGLSLGPELPLVLTASMFGSWIATVCKQSILQARVMSLTAAGAAVGGFFGFPMAGALFVLELPHRMGLQYFEALSPATIASIVAVLCNGFVTGTEVTGLYKYPFLSPTLPSKIFGNAIIYGFYGALVGTIYVVMVKRCKKFVHNIFRPRDDGEQSHHYTSNESRSVGWDGEFEPLVNGKTLSPTTSTLHGASWWTKCANYCTIRHGGLRAIVTGACAGALVGWIGVFLPHVMFWGEAQLQSLIDKGRTPLPIFGSMNEPTGGLTARGFCMIDSSDSEAIHVGLDLGCNFMISAAKIIVTGLSQGAGVGGQFWSPLFLGCSAGHFLVHLVNYLAEHYGFPQIAAHPCVVILCSMGAVHVVTFRAHLAIMLILTLTISTFDSGTNPDLSAAGDYAAVFPLLVVSVFVSLMTTRGTIFYATQRSRGDILAVPEVLCEPGMEGKPLVFEYHGDNDESSFLSTSEDSKSDHPYGNGTFSSLGGGFKQASVTKAQIGEHHHVPSSDHFMDEAEPPGARFTIDRLDELLSKPMESVTVIAEPGAINDREIVGVSDAQSRLLTVQMTMDSPRGGRSRCNSASSARGVHVRITSYGELQDHQPSLMEQARKRAATVDRVHRRADSQNSSIHGEGHRRNCSNLSQGSIRHIRKNSESSFTSRPGSPLPLHRRGRNDHYDAADILLRGDIPAPVTASALALQDIDDVFHSQIR